MMCIIVVVPCQGKIIVTCNMGLGLLSYGCAIYFDSEVDNSGVQSIMKKEHNNYSKEADNVESIDLDMVCSSHQSQRPKISQQKDTTEISQHSLEDGTKKEHLQEDYEAYINCTEEEEQPSSHRTRHQNHPTQSKPVSRLKILRMKFQNTQMAFASQKPQTNRFTQTVTDGLLKNQRPMTKQQPRLISRNFRKGMSGIHEGDQKTSQNNERAQLNKMIQMALRKADKTRPPTSRGIRAKSQSIKVQVQDEEQFLAADGDIPQFSEKIPVKDMYRDRKTTGTSIGSRHRSVELDKIIRLNNRDRSKDGEPKKLPFKTSIEDDFINLFAKSH